MKEKRFETRVCKIHGAQKYRLDGPSFRCTVCVSERVSKHRRDRKTEIVKRLGGKCVHCGYDRYQGALHVHHKDPSQKSFGLSARGITRSLTAALKEIEKCELVCSNCHLEIHAGLKPS